MNLFGKSFRRFCTGNVPLGGTRVERRAVVGVFWLGYRFAAVLNGLDDGGVGLDVVVLLCVR
jgi:hypothetical protein